MAKKKKEEVAVKDTATETNTVEQTETTVETVQLTLQDLQGLANVVDLACRRGAFQAVDMQAVGGVYNKLTGFLAYVVKSQEESAESDGAETPSE